MTRATLRMTGIRWGLAALAALAAAAFVGPAAAQSQTAFDQQWSRLAEAARKEGRLSFSNGAMPDFQPVIDAFAKKFGITVQTTTGSGSARATRILAERKAGRYTTDVGLMSVAAATRRLEPVQALEELPALLIHPDVNDTSKWYGGRHWYVDEGGTQSIFVFTVRAVNTWAFWYNTEKLSAQDIAELKTPRDFLQPRWRAMMADQSWHDLGRVGDMLEIYFAPDGGREWIQRYFSDMNVAFTSDPRLEETWLVRGRNPLKWNEGNIGPSLRELSAKGLPIREVQLPKEQGTLEARGSECCIVVFRNAPNPNAAKLFVNWFLTAEAQQLIHAIDPSRAYTSLREDVAPGNTAEPYRRIPGKSYSFRDFDKEYLTQVEAAREFIVKAFNERAKK